MKNTMILLLLPLLCSLCPAQSSNVSREVSVSQQPLQDIYAALRELTGSLACLKAEVASLRDSQEHKVAFSAALYIEGPQTLGPYSQFTTLVFKNVLTNIGNTYNHYTGVFTAPVRGVYHFEFYIAAIAGPNPAGAALFKNDSRTFVAWEALTQGFESSSQGLSLLLEPGDVVSVRLWPGGQIFDNENHHSTFSGQLLFTI